MRDIVLFSARMTPYLLALLIGVFGTQSLLSSAFLEPAAPPGAEPVSFLVEKGSSIKTIASDLAAQGLVNNAWSMTLLAKLKRIQGPVVAGEYKLSPSMTPEQMLGAILDGNIVYYDVIVPEGTRVDELPALIGATGLVSEAEMSEALQNRQLMVDVGVSAGSFEGYLLPTTYKFTRPIDARGMLIRMRNEGQKQVSDKMIERTIDLGFTFHQILTIASIIERQASVDRERPIISSVLHNRLKIGMPLQSEPTLRYGLKKFQGELTQQDLSAQNAYNTFQNTGLPPTPICNPSIKSIEAALYPADTDYLYFVPRGDGTHEFSSSLKEHTKAVAKYRALNP